MPVANFSGLTLVTPPTANPVSVADAKAHSRIFDSSQDSLIAGYITSATISCEDKCRRAFMPQVWRLALNQWPGRMPGVGYFEPSNIAEYQKWNHIEVPKPPLLSIVSFTYTDTIGNVSNMTPGYGNQVGNYILDTECEPGRVGLPFAGIWPTTILLPHSPIKLTFNCGYPSWSGTMDVDAFGNATLATGDRFDPRLAGTWISLLTESGSPPGIVEEGSFNVLTVVDDSHLTLVVPVPPEPVPLPLAIPASGARWSGNAVPMTIRNAVLYLAAHRYENREPVLTGRSVSAIEIPGTIDAMLAPYKLFIT